MKTILAILSLFLITAACNSRETKEAKTEKDTMDFIPGYGGGHEPGKGEDSGPSFPKETYQNAEERDTSRGTHGVNVENGSANN
jgi:hypothetical protein